MNNKGMTLVELLITFSLLMIIIVGMFNLILDAKIDLDNKQIIKDITEYSNLLNNDIHYDLITKKPFAIAIKQNASTNWYLEYNESYNVGSNCGNNASNPQPCGISGNILRINVSKGEDDDEVRIYGSKDLTNICKNYYPCAVYAYYDVITSSTNANGTIIPSYNVIAANKERTNDKYGVKYNNVFEKLPSQKYIDFKKTNFTMQMDDYFFVIDYSIYIINNNDNYGFKISYPLYDGFSETNNNIEESNDNVDDFG